MYRWILIFICALSVAACESGSTETLKPDDRGGKPALTLEPRPTEVARPTLALNIPTQSGERPTLPSATLPRPTLAAEQPTRSVPTPNVERTTPPVNVPTAHPSAPALPTTNATPIDSYDAVLTITSFAKTMLAKDVSVTRAGGASGNLILPPSVEAQMNSALKLAGAVYVGTLTNGAAEVALGSGGISGDLNADIQVASLGAYSIISNEPAPKDATRAFKLATSTYPAVAGFNYTAQNSQAGFSWYTVTTHAGVDPKTKSAITVAEAVLMGVTPSGARAAVIWIVVGNGTFASSIKP